MVERKTRATTMTSSAYPMTGQNYGLAWGLFPVLFAAAGLTVEKIGILAAAYPAVWGAGSSSPGALSDRIWRKPLIVSGMLVQAGALAMVAVGQDFGIWLAAAVLLGVGTATVYPTLLAAIVDVAHPNWRARSVGTYRFWRDSGFAAGALISGVVADAYGLTAAVGVVAALTGISGIIVAVRMPHRPQTHAPETGTSSLRKQ